jgi:hypothetical protein
MAPVKKNISFYGVSITQLRCAVVLASFPFRRESICEILCSGSSGCQEAVRDKTQNPEQLIRARGLCINIS